MKVEKTRLDGVLLIKLDIFEDHRGQYVEIYNEQVYKRLVGITFVCDDISVSFQNVLRGIHSDNANWKLVSCLEGKIYLVVVNCDVESKDFCEWESFILSDSNRAQVLVPPKYGVGHLVLSDKAIFHYKQSAYYDPSRQFTYRYDDLGFNIWWPIQTPILSRRDTEGHYV